MGTLRPGALAPLESGDLIDYVARRGGVHGGTVVVCDGHLAGSGFDGEPPAVPEHVIITVRWTQFLARHAEFED